MNGTYNSTIITVIFLEYITLRMHCVKAIVHRVDKPNHGFPEMISASIGSGLFVSAITLVMIFDFPNYCASHHINISGDRCHQLVSPVQLATLVTRF